MTACAVLAGLAAGCAGSGFVISDGGRCADWLDGNGRDAYLQAHGLKEYDAGETGRRPETAAVAREITQLCRENPELVIDEALRMAAARVARPPAP